MIVKCEICGEKYEDLYRLKICPHYTKHYHVVRDYSVISNYDELRKCIENVYRSFYTTDNSSETAKTMHRNHQQREQFKDIMEWLEKTHSRDNVIVNHALNMRNLPNPPERDYILKVIIDCLIETNKRLSEFNIELLQKGGYTHVQVNPAAPTNQPHSNAANIKPEDQHQGREQ